MITQEEIRRLDVEIRDQIEAIGSLEKLDEARVQLVGKKGRISLLMRKMGQISIEEKKRIGPLLNRLRDDIDTQIRSKKNLLQDQLIDQKIASEFVDVTLPTAHLQSGGIHPISQVMEECITILAQDGFELAQGPDIEDDFHNFTALNFPEGHPARDMHDTFFVEDEDENGHPKCLRTHTSPVQIRSMLEHGAPLRVIAAGRTFRCDSDQTHTPMFHQIEGLAIDKNITMAHLRGCLEKFIESFFETDDIKTRFRPHYFPFTEPSAEMDVQYHKKDHQLLIGHGDKWMEILGCGMVHPNVLRAVDIDPDEYQGFAFGLGVDRLAMLKYGIPDLRDFFAGDLRWLSHYGFSPFDRPNRAY